MLSASDVRVLNKVLTVARSLELASPEDSFDSQKLAELKELLRATEKSSNPDVKRLSQSADHLHNGMTLRHFLNFTVPVERILNRNLKDDDFLTTRLDRQTPIAQTRPMIFILDNLRSSFNVGSILRLADGVGAEKVFVSGYTPNPGSQAIQKTALGAAIQNQAFGKLSEAIMTARSQGYRVIALETAERSKDLYEPLPEKIAWLVGNERFGIDPTDLKLCDEVRTIPQFGKKNSLNVAVALGIAAYEWQRQWPLS